MAVTISTHNGTAVSREHNIRNRKITDKESHIDPKGKYEVWHDEKLRDAYKRIFGDAVERYNAKQKRADRKIPDYLSAIKKDKKKNAVYEMIATIGNKNNRISEEIGREILMEFVGTWKERNPNLELVGAYYHADEEGVPHVHIDYIPVAHGYKKGLDTQNGLVKALGEMGIEMSEGITAQIQWESAENKYLESLCNEHGYEVEHPKEGRAHLHTDIFKAEQELEKIEYEKIKAECDLSAVLGGIELEQDRLEYHKKKKEEEIELLDAEIDLKKTEIANREDSLRKLIRLESEAHERLTEADKDIEKAETYFNMLLSKCNTLENGLKATEEAKEVLTLLYDLKDLLPEDYHRSYGKPLEEKTIRLADAIKNAEKTYQQQTANRTKRNKPTAPTGGGTDR